MLSETSAVSIGLAVTLAGGVAVLWWRVEAMIAAERRERQSLGERFATYQLEALKTFATATAIEKSEERLVAALDGVTKRLDAAITRIEALTLTVTEMATAMAGSTQLKR